MSRSLSFAVIYVWKLLAIPWHRHFLKIVPKVPCSVKAPVNMQKYHLDQKFHFRKCTLKPLVSSFTCLWGRNEWTAEQHFDISTYSWICIKEIYALESIGQAEDAKKCNNKMCMRRTWYGGWYILGTIWCSHMPEWLALHTAHTLGHTKST